jgi:hypothetical protein
MPGVELSEYQNIRLDFYLSERKEKAETKEA